MREKKESQLGFGDGTRKKRKCFWYFPINVKQERKQRQKKYIHIKNK